MASCIGGIEDTSPLGIKLRNTSTSNFDGMEKQYDKVNPDHYKHHAMECIDEMLALYGPVYTLGFCICSAHKYRYRAGYKVGECAEIDSQKSDWYVAMAKTIRDKYGIDQ